MYGTGYSQDVDIKSYKTRDHVTHREHTIRELQEVVKMYDLVITQMKRENFSISNKRYSTLGSKTLKEQFLFLFQA